MSDDDAWHDNAADKYDDYDNAVSYDDTTAYDDTTHDAPYDVPAYDNATDAASYQAWARPTRRVHLALSVGMTVTGALLVLFGAASGGRTTPHPSAQPLTRTADSVMIGHQGISADSHGIPIGPIRRAPLDDRLAHKARTAHPEHVTHETRTTHAPHTTHAAHVTPPDPRPAPLTPHPSDVSRPVTPPEAPAAPRRSTPPPSHPAER